MGGGGWKISDLTGIQYCTSLQTLDLQHTEIKDFSLLSNLISLRNLNLKGNQIEDISSLATLTNLFILNLKINKISDIYPLVENGGIDNKDIIYLNDNPLSEISKLLYIPQLEARGVRIVR